MIKQKAFVARMAMAGIVLAGVHGAAYAQGWSLAQEGKIRVKSGQDGNFTEVPSGSDLMQYVSKTSGNASMEIGFGANPTTWFDLLGIKGIWRIDPTMNAPVGDSVDQGSLVTGSGVDDVSWAQDDGGYSAGGAFDEVTPWIRLVSDSSLGLYGMSGLTGYTEGIFGFMDVPSGSVLGIDYLVGDGAGQTSTGKVYFSPSNGNTGGGTTTGGGSTGGNGNGTGDPVPEPGEWAAMGILGAGLLGLMARGRRRKS